MSERASLLSLRVREDHSGASQPQRVEVLDVHGEILGQLMATRAVYELTPRDCGTLTVTVRVESADVASMRPGLPRP